MKHLLLVFAALAAIACSYEDFIRANAEKYVRKVYPDVDRILHYSVDTVTIGDNMDYRIQMWQDRVDRQMGFAKDFEKIAEEDKRLRYIDAYESARESQMKFLREAEKIQKELNALDSLKQTLSPEVLNHATAFTCCIAYNVPSNLVWIQLDEYGNLLKISKDKLDLFLNPGADAPGYLDLIQSFSK